ncbi:MAG: metallophosphoesterase, partial [Bacteroides sp.]|nr:metallophosphoesterase [Bacteroides sp.]
MRHLLELFLFFIVLMGLPDWYIYRHYIKQWKHTWGRRLYWLPSILLLIGMTIVFCTFEPRPEAMNRLGLFLILFLCVNVPKAIFSLLTLLHKRMTRIAIAIALLAMGTIIYGATEGIQHFQVKEVDIHSKDLPEGFQDYRIVQIADIHCGSWSDHAKAMQKAVNIINALQPDLIVFTGDLVNNLSSELDEFMPVLSQLKAKDGVYSVLGNHDYSMYIRWENETDRLADLDSLKAKQAQMGWTLLNNRHVKLYQGQDSIALIGVENSGRPPFP